MRRLFTTSTPKRSHRRSTALAAATAVIALVASGLTLGLLAAPASADANIQLSADVDSAVLAGGEGSVTLTAQNLNATTNFYNLSLSYELPPGVSYTSGSTTPVTAGEPRVITVSVADPTPDDPAHVITHEVLLWENVSDLAAGAAFRLHFAVTPDPDTYPVGSSFSGTAGAFANSNPRIMPKFTAAGAPNGDADATAIRPAGTTTVSAVQLDKSEPSPESELMRGVHTNSTTYTLNVQNTTVAATTDLVIVDYLPAGLEFLGCGGAVDNGGLEYPGAPALSSPILDPCLTPDSVQTVDNAPVGAGVFTKVTWTIPALAAGETTQIRYRAAIPLNENQMWPSGTVPAAQWANLDNNTGPSTRQDEATTGLVNTATVTGTYTGSVVDESDRTVSDSDTEVVQPSDFSIVKRASTGQFSTGNTVAFSLDLRASEYVSAGDLVVTDTLPDGLCLLLPADSTVTPTGTVPTGCTATGAVTNGTVLSVDYRADGTSTFTLAPQRQSDSSGELSSTGPYTVTYQALMRDSYSPTSSPVVGGDSFGNHVDVAGTTTSLDDANGNPLEQPVTVGVTDDSTATLRTSNPTITKLVLPRTDLGSGACPTSGYISPSSTVPTPVFQLGDRVCFQLVVNFSDTADTRNAQVTDFLPSGLAFDPSSTTITATSPPVNLLADPAAPNSPTWEVGETRGGTDLYVDKGAQLVLFVGATVIAPSATDRVDITANLMKYRQESSAGTVLSLRNQADLGIAPPPLVELDKAVGAVNGIPYTGSSTSPGALVGETDTVTFAVSARNLGTAAAGNDFPVQNVDVWDALPAGIACADVTALPLTASCTDTNLLMGSYAGRSLITMTIAGPIAAADSAGFSYDVAIPLGTSVSSILTNTVSVVALQTVNTTGTGTTFVPAGSLNALATPTIDPIAFASASVHLPAATVVKSGQSRIVEANNDALQAVAGELVDYQYSVSIPANSTVYDAVLSDALPSRLELVPGTTVVTADLPLPGGTGVDAATIIPFGYSLGDDGTLTFPTTVDNTSTSPLVFTVYLQGVRVTNDASPGAATNTATFDSNFTSGGIPVTPAPHADFVLPIVEPKPTISKSVDSPTVTSGQNVTFTLTLGDTATTPPLHDGVLVDCLPAGLEFLAFGPDSFSHAAEVGNGTNGCALGTQRLEWTVGTVLPTGAPVVVTYTAKVDPQAVGLVSYVNTATITGTTIPGGGKTITASTSATTTVQGVTTTKTVAKARATIGETNSYTITVTLPAKVNFFRAAVIDSLPAGVVIDGTVAVSCAASTPAPTTDCGSDLPAGGSALAPQAGPTAATSYAGWFLGDVQARDWVRTVTVTVPVRVADVASTIIGTTIHNEARMSWFDSAGPDPADAGVNFPLDGQLGTVDFIATGPALSLTKTVSSTTPAPGDVFTYTVRATNANTANTSAAYNITVVDEAPKGVVIQTPVSNGGVVTPNTTTGGTTITWNLSGPLARNGSVSLTYTATLAPSNTLTAAGLRNTVDVPSYTSLPTGGRSYDNVVPRQATVTPKFPAVTGTKTVQSGDVAYLNTPFGWTLTLKNAATASTAHDVTATDVLPANWRYTAGSARLTLAGVDLGQIDPVSTTIDPITKVQTLVWAPQGPLPAGRELVINFDATPLTAAGTNPGIGSTVAHRNTLTAVATDATGATGRSGALYATGAPTASAHIDSADLAVVKAAGSALVAGTTVTDAWTITVTNRGSDPALGTSGSPFTVSDTAGTLPTGVTVVAASGSGWSCTTPSPDFTCTRTGTLASGSSFAPITVGVRVDADVAAGTVIGNTATVSTATYDPNTGNNTSSKDITVTTSADLAVTKTINGTARAGTSVSWTVGVTNLGPSFSAAGVVVTDTLPTSGLSNVTASGAGWACVVGSSTVTCTRGTAIPVGPTDSITITGDLAPSLSGTISNTAAITTTTTPDPDTTNNTDTANSPVDIATVVTLDKTLVAPVVDGSPAVVPGANSVYEFTVTNQGPADARDITITDDLPLGLSFVSASSVVGAWSCTGGTSFTCALSGSLPATGTTTATVRVTVAVPSDLATATVINTAVVHGSNSPDYDDTSISGSSERANFSIVKSHPAGAVVAGTSVTYELAVTNVGPSDSPGTVTVVDTLPAGMSAELAEDPTGQWTCDIAGQVVTCDLPAGLVASAAAPVIEVTARVLPDAGPSTLVNHATVAGPLPSDDRSHASTDDATDIIDRASVTITKTATSGSTVRAGQDVTYSLTVENLGPSNADQLLVSDALPAGLSLVSLSGSGWTCTLASATCARATLAPGVSTITVVAHVASSVADGATLRNVAAVDWLSGTTPQHDEDAATVTVTAEADLALSKRTLSSTAVAGETATFILTVRNLGPSDAQGPVTIVDTLPAGLTFVSSSPEWDCVPGAATNSGQRVSCVLPSSAGIPAGTTASTLSITTQIDEGLAAGLVTNTAVVSAATDDPSTTNNTDQAQVTIEPLADLAIVKSHTGTVQVGGDLAFRLRVTNAGPSTATAVAVVDTLPEGLTYVDSAGSNSDWTCVAGSTSASGQTPVTCELSSDLRAGDAAPTLIINTQVTADAYPRVANIADVASDTAEANPGDNHTTDAVTVPPLVALQVTKTHLDDLRIGQPGRYLITVHNAGPTEDPGGFTVTDTLPTGLRYTGASGDRVDCVASGQTVLCTFRDSLAAGDTRSVTISVMVLPTAPSTVVNSVIASSLYQQTSDAQLTAVDTAPILPANTMAYTGAGLNLGLIILGAGILIIGVTLILLPRIRRRKTEARRQASLESK